MLTIVGDWQRFLGVNVPHLGCVFCGMSEGRIVVVVVVVRSVVKRIEIRRPWWSEIRGGRVVRRLADRCGLVPFFARVGQPRAPTASGTQLWYRHVRRRQNITKRNLHIHCALARAWRAVEVASSFSKGEMRPSVPENLRLRCCHYCYQSRLPVREFKHLNGRYYMGYSDNKMIFIHGSYYIIHLPKSYQNCPERHTMHPLYSCQHTYLR